MTWSSWGAGVIPWLWNVWWLSALCQKGLLSQTNWKIEVRWSNIQGQSRVRYKIDTYPAFFKKFHCIIFQSSPEKAQRIAQVKNPRDTEKGTRIWEHGCFEHSVENGRSMTLLSEPCEGQVRALHSPGKCTFLSQRRKDWKAWRGSLCLSWKTQRCHLFLALKPSESHYIVGKWPRTTTSASLKEMHQGRRTHFVKKVNS